MESNEFIDKVKRFTKLDYPTLQRVIGYIKAADNDFNIAYSSVLSNDASGIIFNTFAAGEAIAHASCTFDASNPTDSDLALFRDAYFKYTSEQMEKISNALKQKIKNIVG
jgi:tRNA A37 threonylcarbamoyltransferase TsaD